MFNRDEIDRLKNQVKYLEDRVTALENNTIVYEKKQFTTWDSYMPARIPINNVINAILLHLKLGAKKVYQHENVIVNPIGKKK